MKKLPYVLSLISFAVLAYFNHVERDYPTALVIWLGVCGLFYAVKPLRAQAPLILLVGLCGCFRVVISNLSPIRLWPFDFYLTALFGFFIYRYIFKKPFGKLKWSFNFTKHEWASIFAINIPSIVVLLWYYSIHPEVSKTFPALDVPLWSLPFVIIVLAAINGLREELFYRGLVQTASNPSPTWFVIALQALLFGFLHYSNSFPQGWLGVGLTALWGSLIAVQYHWSKSIALAWVTHAMADACMVGIIIYTRS